MQVVNSRLDIGTVLAIESNGNAMGGVMIYAWNIPKIDRMKNVRDVLYDMCAQRNNSTSKRKRQRIFLALTARGKLSSLGQASVRDRCRQ